MIWTFICMLTTQWHAKISIQLMIIASSSMTLTFSEWPSSWLIDFNVCKMVILQLQNCATHGSSNICFLGVLFDYIDNHEYLGATI